MDEALEIREGARRIHELGVVVSEKIDLHRGLMDILRNVTRDNYHKRYIHNLAYLIQGIEYNLKAIQDHQRENAKQKGKYLERSWFSRLISLFENDESYYTELKDLIDQTRVIFEKMEDIEKNGITFDLDPEKERTITNYLKLAQHHLTVDKDINSAEACYRAAGNIAEISDILIGMGNVRRLQNRVEEAQQFYRRAIETNPKEESAYLKLYTLAQEKGQVEDVLKSLLDLGQFYTKTGKLTQASNSYIQVLSKTSNRASASPTAALQKLGECVDKCAESDPPLFCSIFDQVSQEDWILVLGHTKALPAVTTRLRNKVKQDLTPNLALFDEISYAILQTYPPDNELKEILFSLTPQLPASDRKPADYPPLHYACYIGLRNLVRCLIHINYPDLSNTAKCNQTPIQCATVGGHTDVVKLLISKGAKLDRDFGSLSMAVTLDRRDIFTLLIRSGASVEFSDEQGRTVLHLASVMNRIEIVTAILHTKPDAVKKRDTTGVTPLYLAALQGWVTISQLLLKSGANVNEFTEESWAPLHAAIMNNHIDCFMTLFSCGAWDVNLGKKNPFELAMKKRFLEAAQLLVYYYPAYVINFLEPEVAQDTPHRRFSMHATEALLSRALNYHLYGLAHHVQSDRETTPQKWWGVALRCLEDAKLKTPNEESLKRVTMNEALIFLDIGYLNFTNKRNKHALQAYRSSMDSVITAQGYWRLGELYHATRDLQSAQENLNSALNMGGGAYVMYDQKSWDYCVKPVADLLQFQKVAGFRVDLLAGYLLVNIFNSEDDTASAEAVVGHLRELVAAMPCSLSYYILGSAYMELRNETQAVQAFHEGLTLRCTPSLACALRYCLAYVHETQDQYDEAEACYTAIMQTDLSLDPQSRRGKRTDIGIILKLGQAQYFQGKRALALDTFKRITSDPYLSTLNQKIPSLDREQAEHLVQGFRLADINHQIGLAYYYLGLLYRDYDYKEATEFLQQACKYHPHIALEALQQIRDDKVKKERDASPLLVEARGILKHRPGSVTHTVPPVPTNARGSVYAAFNSIFAHTPSSTATAPVAIPQANANNEEVHVGSYYRPRYVPQVASTLSQAKTLLQKALRIHPQYSEACYLLGVCFMYESDFDTAVKHIQRSILMDPFYVDAYFDLANIFMRLCRLDDAVVCCEKAISNWRGFEHAFFSKDEAMCLLADIYIKQGNFKLAEDRYSEALQIKPDPVKQKFLANIQNTLASMTVPDKVAHLSLLYDKWLQCSPDWNRVRIINKVATLQEYDLTATKGRKNTLDEKAQDTAKATQTLIQWKLSQLTPMTKSVLMGLHSLIQKCREDRYLYSLFDANTKRICDFFVQDIFPPVQQYFIDKYALSELAATHDPECFNKRVPLLLELRKTEHATYQKIVLYNSIISQESFLKLVNPSMLEPIQAATGIFTAFVTDSKLLWKAVKKAIPKTAKEMSDDAAVAKVVENICQAYIKHIPTYLFTLQKIKEKTNTFDVVLKGPLQTWWNQYKTTEAETIRIKHKAETINIVADGFNIAINSLQFGPRRQLFTKQLLQAYVKTPRRAKPHSPLDPLATLAAAPQKTAEAPKDIPANPAATAAAEAKKKTIMRKREKKREKKKAKEEKEKLLDNHFLGQLTTALKIIIEGNSKL